MICGEQRVSSFLVIQEGNFMVGINHRLNYSARIDPQFFGAVEQGARTYKRADNPRAAEREQKLASLAIDQQHAGNGHQEIDERKNNVPPMRLNVRKTALHQDMRVVSDVEVHDGVL